MYWSGSNNNVVPGCQGRVCWLTEEFTTFCLLNMNLIYGITAARCPFCKMMSVTHRAVELVLKLEQQQTNLFFKCSK